MFPDAIRIPGKHDNGLLLTLKKNQMDLRLQNKIAFISGSTSGIGYAIAKRLLQEGATVIINGRTKESVNQAVTDLKKLVPGSNVSGNPADFSRVDEVNQLIKAIPHLDILINNAGFLNRFLSKIFPMKTGSNCLR